MGVRSFLSPLLELLSSLNHTHDTPDNMQNTLQSRRTAQAVQPETRQPAEQTIPTLA